MDLHTSISPPQTLYPGVLPPQGPTGRSTVVQVGVQSMCVSCDPVTTRGKSHKIKEFHLLETESRLGVEEKGGM